MVDGNRISNLYIFYSSKEHIIFAVADNLWQVIRNFIFGHV